MRSERGAVTIHVAIALTALIMFMGIVLDQGTFFVSRRQAQNAADAGALAGALTLLTDPLDVNNAKATAKDIANGNGIWGQAPGLANIEVTHPILCPDNVDPNCIRVDVYRGLNRANAAQGTAVPRYITGMLTGQTTQPVRATATAQVAAGNTVLLCIKPWAVVDRWVDHSGTGTDPAGYDQMDVFNPGVDEYIQAEGWKATGTPNDIGTQLMLKGEGSEWSSGWSMTVDLGNGNGGNVVRDEIGNCPNWVPEVGIWNPSVPCSSPPDTDEPRGCLNVTDGVKQGPTTQGVGDLLTRDPGASWDIANKTVVGGCTATSTCRSVNQAGLDISPRIVPIALFNPQAYLDVGGNGNNGMARVVNIMGFFVEGMCSDVYPTSPPAWCGSGPQDAAKTVVGRLMMYPGQYRQSAGPAGPNSFLRFTRLVK
jgi:hypothetical protein